MRGKANEEDSQRERDGAGLLAQRKRKKAKAKGKILERDRAERSETTIHKEQEAERKCEERENATER